MGCRPTRSSGLGRTALGAAACLKLYPLFAFVYFLFSRRWLALLTGVLVFLSINGIGLLVLGLHEFETYVNDARA